MKRALFALAVAFVLCACATIIGVSSDVVDVGVDGATDAADESDGTTE